MLVIPVPLALFPIQYKFVRALQAPVVIHISGCDTLAQLNHKWVACASEYERYEGIYILDKGLLRYMTYLLWIWELSCALHRAANGFRYVINVLNKCPTWLFWSTNCCHRSVSIPRLLLSHFRGGHLDNLMECQLSSVFTHRSGFL